VGVKHSAKIPDLSDADTRSASRCKFTVEGDLRRRDVPMNIRQLMDSLLPRRAPQEGLPVRGRHAHQRARLKAREGRRPPKAATA
jgi:ribosomal protein S13